MGISRHYVLAVCLALVAAGLPLAPSHRAAAFDACRWLIDSLKKTVPIWKKETFEDGVVWADGEPFPDAVAVQSRGMAE